MVDKNKKRACNQLWLQAFLIYSEGVADTAQDIVISHKSPCSRVFKNFSSPSINLKTIGYSCSGFVEKSNVKGFNAGDRVACAGSSHAEVIYSPKNLTVKIPENVSVEEVIYSNVLTDSTLFNVICKFFFSSTSFLPTLCRR